MINYNMNWDTENTILIVNVPYEVALPSFFIYFYSLQTNTILIGRVIDF